MNIQQIMADQRSYFAKGETLDINFRRSMLQALKNAILTHEKEINDALQADLRKSESEGYMCEIGMTLAELNYMLRHMNGWAKPHYVVSPLVQFPSSSFTVKNPYGVVLIMSPWNYPFMLTMEPLIGALAAGNCCVVKPSAYAPATSKIIARIIGECFSPEYVCAVEGGRKENQELLDQRFDYIFFTGGVSVGKEVMRKASEHLTPVSLELGGKSPCIVDETARLDVAAKRLAFGKLLNCGQTCVAPDYLLIDRKIKDEFLALLQKHITDMIGEDARSNSSYVRMINRKHFDRVCSLIDPDKVIFGGKSNPDTLTIQPTILDRVTEEDAVMQEEIFGPVLPVIAYDSIDEAIEMINRREHPLALYLFSEDKATWHRFLSAVPFGGGCINDTIIHLATSRMGFGGVGHSGMGSYHGKKSFDTFSHEKSIVKKATWLDLPFRYLPYNRLKDMLVRMFLR